MALVELKRCKLSSQFEEISPSGTVTESGGTVFELMHVDPSRVNAQADVNNVILEARNSKKIFEREYCSGGICRTEMVNYVAINDILSPAGDNAPRVARAMAHMVELCGGKEELF